MKYYYATITRLKLNKQADHPLLEEHEECVHKKTCPKWKQFKYS
jgi:hypothetical protein